MKDSKNRDEVFDTLRKFRDVDIMKFLINEIHNISHTPIYIMEVCGGQTYALAKYGIEELLPPTIQMIHGPGCPVCVTPSSTIDQAIELAMNDRVIFCTFGDMMRVPGDSGSLLQCRAKGADVRMLYTPIDALTIAKENPTKEVVFFAIGFETTTPTYAIIIEQCVKQQISNLSLLTSLFTVPAAVRALSKDPDCKLDALLAAGHVCAIEGTDDYKSLSNDLSIPISITGFEPVDLLKGILTVTQQHENSQHTLVNDYARVVSPEGNIKAQKEIAKYFERYDAEWRGLGKIPTSGLRIKPFFEQFNVKTRFSLTTPEAVAQSVCISGDIMKGKKKPSDCPFFGNKCTPQSPIGAPMVSAEGVCAAFYKFKQ